MAYIGKSMSVNAKDSYNMGQKPLSKWSRKDIIDSYPEKHRERLNTYDDETLKQVFLEPKGWHHTSKFYNKTNFYAPYENLLDEEMDVYFQDADAITKSKNELKTAIDQYPQYADKFKDIKGLTPNLVNELVKLWENKK